MDNQEANTHTQTHTNTHLNVLVTKHFANKKFHKTGDRNEARDEVTYHFSAIDRSHYVLSKH